jgi:hypothetical protein
MDYQKSMNQTRNTTMNRNFFTITVALLLMAASLPAQQKTEESMLQEYSTGRFIEVLRPYQTGDYAVGIQAKGKLANVMTNFGELGSFHVFAPAFEWPAYGDGQADEQQYGWGINIMLGINGDVLESFKDPASDLISRDWAPAAENLFSGNVTVSESDITPIMATSDNPDTWPLDDSNQPFWPGDFRRDSDGNEVPGQFVSERDLFSVLTDEGNPTQYGLRVEQTAYSFARGYAEDFLAYRYKFQNTSTSDLNGIYPGMMNQFLIDFDNHDMIDFIDTNNDGQKDFILMWDTDGLPRPPWVKVGYIGLLLVKSPAPEGITNFHFFHDDFIPSKDADFWRLMISDTTGLPDTTRQKYFHGSDFRIDNVSYSAGLDPEGQDRGGEITWVFSMGPVDLPAGGEFLWDFAIVAGDDREDILNNVRWIWDLAANNWNGPNPPDAPKVNAYAGDGKVTLVWDALSSENSRDNVTGEKDFEGYKVYRSTDHGKTWGETITDNRGRFVGFVPMAQFDKINGISGDDPISGSWLGNNSGIRHTFVDTTVTNGIEYWYTVTAYDRGQPGVIESLESALGLTVSEKNVSAAIPQAPPVNLSAGSLAGDELLQPVSGNSDALVRVEVIDPNGLVSRNYQLTFRQETPVYQDGVKVDSITTFTLKDKDSGEILVSEHALSDSTLDNLPVIEGLRLVIRDVEPGIREMGWTKVAADTCTFYWDINPIGANDYPVVYTYDDFKVVIDEAVGIEVPLYDLWAEEPFDTTAHLPLRIYMISDPANPVDVSELTQLGEFISSPFGILSPPGWDLVPGGAGFAPNFPYPDRIIMEYVDADGDTSGLRLVTQNGPASATPPSDGDEFSIVVNKPLTEKVVYEFSTTGSNLRTAASSDLSKIRVVPNPFLVSASLGERLMFTHLPANCQIRIFNVAGDLIRELDHNSGTGMRYWDLKNQQGLEVAYGLYVYVVKTPDGEKRIGKFSLIR